MSKRKSDKRRIKKSGRIISIYDFDDVEIRNMVYKLEKMLEDIDDLKYEKEEHECRLDLLRKKIDALENKRKDFEAEINSQIDKLEEA